MRTIAFEGPCCVGKSACIDILFRKFQIPSVPEFTDIVGELPPFPPQSMAEVQEAMEYFARLENKRHAMWKRLCDEQAKRNHVIALDRSFLSVVAFQEASRSLLGNQVVFDARGFWDGCSPLVLPDLVVLLQASHDILIKRSANAQGEYYPVLLDQEFNRRFNESVVQQCQVRRIEYMTIDVSNLSAAEVVSVMLPKLSP
jgi:thymidylate kinase